MATCPNQNQSYRRIARLGIVGQGENAGFVLMMTLLAMAAIFVVIVAMLSLSLAESASENTAGHMPKARNNAVLALDEAIANLQSMAGSDTRVTAPAEAVAGVNGSPYVTGVWRSWEGLNHNASTGLPIKPDYTIKTVGYDESSPARGRFLGWLVSDSQQNNAASDPPVLTEDTAAGTVPLLDEGTVGSGATDKEIHMVPTIVRDSKDTYDTGSYAWWIQGENTKAWITGPGEPLTETYEWSRKLASYGQPDVESFGFSDPDELTTLPNRKAMDLAANSGSSSSVSGEYFHDVTIYARGLLTNTANGGWKRDLSLMGEKWYENVDGSGNPVGVTIGSPGGLPTTGLPVFTVDPLGSDLTSSLRLSDSPNEAAIYPWVTENNISMSWNALLDFVSLYKKVQLNPTSGAPYLKAQTTLTSDWLNIQPILARYHMAFGYDASVIASGSDAGKYQPQILFKPAITLWNPYNVALESAVLGEPRINAGVFPMNLYATIGSSAEEKVDIKSCISGQRAHLRLLIQEGASDDATWKPGESRIYGKPGIDAETGRFNWDYTDPGYHTDGAIRSELRFDSGVAPPGDATDAYTFRWEYKTTAGTLACDMSYNKDRSASGANNPDQTDHKVNGFRTKRVATSTATISEKLPLPALTNDSQTLGLVEPAKADSPFLVVTYGLRALVNESDPLNEGLAGTLPKVHTKGYINTKPITVGVTMNGGTTVEDSSYVCEVFAPNTWNDEYLPQSFDGASFGNDHGSFVGTSFQAAHGLSRFIIAELPTQPLLSLGELQHFDVSYTNQYPPRVANAIGNSHASPHITSDAVANSLINVASYDHSYVSNHVLFDDWFISSLTPEMEPYTSTENRSIENVYADHLSTTSPLPNRHYVPANPKSPAEALVSANTIFADDAAEGDPREMLWYTIASKLEVRGMFNINSTSVEAWKALLKSLKSAEVPFAQVGAANPDDWRLDSMSASETPVSRTTVVDDPNTSANSAATFVSMTDVQVDALAEEIVEQIKLRGPFLSLSEFINRQLTTDQDLAMAGAIEAALMDLSDLGVGDPANPFADIQSEFPQQAELPSDGAVIYEFPDAAVGDAAYGMPGWPRQSDILRPLAPIIAARDDTFIIRTYGDSRNKSGKVIARTWCEAVVQRKADYVDSADSSTKRESLSTVNQNFGRRFDIVSFRWLSPEEV